ncbi:MAG: RDD family protein [Haliscomenobacter sp.]|uniref:RDD family protein n=1 Tax=Haliscomenobacter sp. TaxID=2717303 RepID=UPI0029A794C5|nr:RDD family protein [Haliscomenobacter sp.]MDX2067145.1 RDD family protein [Haliscomenobacter sp.]
MQNEELLDDFHFTPTEESITDLVSASVGQRLANYIIDSIVMQTLLYFAIIAIDQSTYLAKNAESSFVFVFLGLALLPFGYLWGCEYFIGRTLGKLITGTRVVYDDGTRPSVISILVRTLARAVPFEPFSIFFNEDRIMWHDQWSHTMVVDVKKSVLSQDV